MLAVLGGASPTGQRTIDAGLVVAAVAAVTWYSMVVPTRFAATLVLLAASATATWPGLTVGAICFVVTAAVPHGHGGRHWLNAALLALTLNLTVRSELDWFFGASSLIGVLIAVAALARACPRRTRLARRGLAVVVSAAALVSIVAGATLAVSATQSRDDLSAGERSVRRGLDQLLEGDADSAVSAFEEAGQRFDSAHSRLSGPVTGIAAMVPVAAQHRRAGVELTNEARRSSETLAAEVGQIDLDRLTISEGRVDVDAIAALAEPLAAARADISTLRDTVGGIDGPWLLGAVRERLDRLENDIDEQLDRSDLFVDLVDQLPAMLGQDGARRYFVAFTTPSEVRGLGGFMGNWAEITVDDGAIEMSRFGRSDDLINAAVPGASVVTGPADWLELYGRFGFEGARRPQWKNITMSPSMASTGEVIAELYPQSGGRRVDGVFALDVVALSALLDVTGPIRLPGDAGSINSTGAPRFLLNGQYDLEDGGGRVDTLEIVSSRVFAALLDGDLPPPIELLDLLSPFAEQGRLAGYAVQPDEQLLFEAAGLAGTLVDPDGADGIAITYNNTIGNKIDFYHRSSAEYRVVADDRDDDVSATLELDLRNDAPASGEPSIVIGNHLGAPSGANRTLVSIHSQLPLDRALLGGAEISTAQFVEVGYFVTEVVVELSAGQSDSLRFEFSGTLDLSNGYELVLRSPPTVEPVAVTVDAVLLSDDGDRREHADFKRPGQHEISVGRIRN